MGLCRHRCATGFKIGLVDPSSGNGSDVNLTRRAGFAILGASAVLMLIAMLADLSATYSGDLRAALVILTLVAYGTIVVLARKGLGHYR
jgi:hypothetical protein